MPVTLISRNKLNRIIEEEKPRIKSIFDDRKTIFVMDLAYAGFTIKTIARITHLTEGQVAYRLQRLGISTLDYRNGESLYAKDLIKEIRAQLRGINNPAQVIKEKINYA